MGCYSFSAQMCSLQDPTSSICWSSSGSKIITSVTSGKSTCNFRYVLYLDIWEPSQGEWAQLGYRNGYTSIGGDDQEFNAPITTSRTYRLRLELKDIPRGVYTKWTTPSFTHAG